MVSVDNLVLHRYPISYLLVLFARVSVSRSSGRLSFASGIRIASRAGLMQHFTDLGRNICFVCLFSILSHVSSEFTAAGILMGGVKLRFECGGGEEMLIPNWW